MHALILPDGPTEYDPFLGVTRRLGDEPLRIADAFRCNQDALGVHAAQNVAKTLALLADQIFRRNAQIIEK